MPKLIFEKVHTDVIDFISYKEFIDLVDAKLEAEALIFERTYGIPLRNPTKRNGLPGATVDYLNQSFIRQHIYEV